MLMNRIVSFREENRVRAEKIDYDQKMEKYEETIANHQAKIEHWKKEMSKIKLHSTDASPNPELKLLSDEELADVRQETLQNFMTKAELELGKLSPNLQVKIIQSLGCTSSFHVSVYNFHPHSNIKSE